MFSRDPDRSASELGQWVHDNLPRTFFWMDADGFVYKRATNILRMIEQKQPGQRLKPSQNKILPLIAQMIMVSVESGQLHPDSGVFIVHTSPPYTIGSITEVGGKGRIASLSNETFKQFLSGEPVFIKEENPSNQRAIW